MSMNAVRRAAEPARVEGSFVIQRPKVGEILVAAGVIDEMQLRAALGDQASWGGRLGVALVKMGLIEEKELVRALAQQLQIPVVQLDGKRVQREVLDLIPVDLAEKHSCVPLFLKEQSGIKTLFVGMDDPSDLAAIDDLSFRTGLRIGPVLVSPSELCEAIDRFYHRSSLTAETLGEGESPNALSMNGPALKGVAGQRAAAQIAESLIPDAVSLGEISEDPKIPDDFEPRTVLEMEAAAAIATPGTPATPAVEVDDPNRTILRALCQLLIEKGVLTTDELQARVRKLEVG
jgi:hypothetical protein